MKRSQIILIATVCALFLPVARLVAVGTEKCPLTIGTVSASPNVLWPPNHKMVKVTVSYLPSCPSTCFLTVGSSEPENGTGDGDTAPDWQVLDPTHVLLRAERAGPGPGRTYTITIHCQGNNTPASTTVQVTVPHNQ
jgi:hypothetical protein